MGVRVWLTDGSFQDFQHRSGRSVKVSRDYLAESAGTSYRVEDGDWLLVIELYNVYGYSSDDDSLAYTLNDYPTSFEHYEEELARFRPAVWTRVEKF